MTEDLIILFFTVILIDNFVFFKVLGVKTFLDAGIPVAKRIEVFTVVTFAVLGAVLINGLIFKFVLSPFNLGGLRTFVFAAVTAGVNYLAKFLARNRGYDCFESGVPFMTNSCLVMAVCFMASGKGFALFESLRYALGVCVGFFASMLVFSSLLERIELSDLPDFMKGMPGIFISAGLVALSLLGFSSFKF